MIQFRHLIGWVFICFLTAGCDKQQASNYQIPIPSCRMDSFHINRFWLQKTSAEFLRFKFCCNNLYWLDVKGEKGALLVSVAALNKVAAMIIFLFRIGFVLMSQRTEQLLN